MYPASSIATQSVGLDDRQVRPPIRGHFLQRKRPGRSRTSMLVTPTMRSWNEFFTFIEEWDELRMAA